MFVTTAGIVVETKELWDELQKHLADFPLRIVFEQPQILDWPGFADKLLRLAPDLVFLDVTGRKDAGDIVRRIRALPPHPAVFALNTEANAAGVLECVRAGTSEYLIPPFGDALGEAFRRLFAERQSRIQTLRPGAKVLGFFSAKGGCGATTIACHTAIELTHQTKGKVLMADLDLEAGLVSFLLKTKSPYSLIDAVQNLHRLDPSYWSALVANGIPNMETLTAPTGITARPSEPEELKQVFDFCRTLYDWIVVDLGRGLSALTLACLQNCDQVYLITTAELPALHQSQQLMSRLVASGMPGDRLRIVLNRPPKRMEVTESELEKMLGAPIYFVVPNEYQALNESFVEGKLMAPGSTLGRSFTALARKIAGVEEPAKKRFSLFG